MVAAVDYGVQLLCTLSQIPKKGVVIQMKQFTGYQRGMNLGGWLSQCAHSDAHHDTFITERDIAQIAAWGLDHVRLPIDYELVRDTDDRLIEQGFSYIDACLAWCEKYKLNMILDLHKTLGYTFDQSGLDFFNAPQLQDKFVSFWEVLAKRYGRYSDRLAFELLNEVVEESVADIWNDIIKRTIPAIRAYAPVTKIIVGGVRNNSVLWVRKLDAPYDENVVYTFHFYEPLIFTHQKAYWVDKMTTDFVTEYPNNITTLIEQTKTYLPPEHSEFYKKICTPQADIDFIRASFAEAVAVAEERGAAIYCGEYGVIDRTSLPSALNWFSDIHAVFEECGIGRAVWTYKAKDFGITDAHYSPVLEQLIALL